MTRIILHLDESTIVPLIEQTELHTVDTNAEILKTAEILEGYDQIIELWQRRMAEIGVSPDNSGVVESVRRQNRYPGHRWMTRIDSDYRNEHRARRGDSHGILAVRHFLFCDSMAAEDTPSHFWHA